MLITSWIVVSEPTLTANCVPSGRWMMKSGPDGRGLNALAVVELCQRRRAGERAHAELRGGLAAVFSDRKIGAAEPRKDVDARAGGIDFRQHGRARAVERVQQIADGRNRR